MTTTPSLSLTVDTKGEAPIDLAQFASLAGGKWEWDGKVTVTIQHPNGEYSFRTAPEIARFIVAAPRIAGELKSARERIVELQDDLDRAHGAIRDALAQLDALAAVESQP